METADHILIPLLDGTHTLAQIARIEDGKALLYVTRTIATPDTQPKPFSDPQVIAGFCMDAAALPTGLWPVIGYEAVPRIAPFSEWVLMFKDAQDPTIIEAFANAIHGLYPWDGFPDAGFFTNMLRAPEALPVKARMTADFPKPT